MEISIGHVVGTIIGGLCVAGLVAFVKKRRTYLYIPRLFPHSSLSDSGGIVELVVANKGFLSEEALQIVLKPRLRYQLVATTLKSIGLTDGIVQIPRLAPGQEISVILLVEGGEFSEAEIAAATSKEAVIRVLSKDAKPENPTLGGAARVLVMLFALIFGAAYGASVLTEDIGRNAFHFTYDHAFDRPNLEHRAALEKDGWTDLTKFFGGGGLAKYYPAGKFPVEKFSAVRNGNFVVITGEIVNLTPGYLDTTVFSKYQKDSATAREGGVDYSSTMTAPDNRSRLLLNIYLPPKEGAQKVILKFSFAADDLRSEAVKVIDLGAIISR